ncbi:serine Protease Immune Response Integrator [Haematobia irritans]|uniref:serine Protease Immune Response Integrator n=1 Tax=Haematobia irritans TaxID=7368 RepID=UPI003F4FE36F
MHGYWHIFNIFIILVKENYGEPSILPKSQRGIIYPTDNWDDCTLDTPFKQPGQCTNIENCPEVLYKWQKENIYPKTCYFIKKDHYVCCPKSAALNTREIVTIKPIESIELMTPSSTSSLLDELQLEQRRSELECDLNTRVQSTIVHGTPTKKDEFPFMAALGWTNRFNNEIWYRCGGVVISPRFVLTAAHCQDIGGEMASVVRIGGSNLTDNSVRDVKIKRFIRHPDYRPPQVYNDIGLVELNEDVKDVYAACLWTKDMLNSETLTAIGYGHTQFGGIGSQQLLKTDLKAVSNKDCLKFYSNDYAEAPNGILSSQLCAGDPVGLRDTCQGDSGGPLVNLVGPFKRGYVVAITSFGLGCASGSPAIYTRVSSYLDWIETLVWPKLDTRFS